MIKKLPFLLFLIFSISLYAQEWSRSRLDSLFNFYAASHNYGQVNFPLNLNEDTLRSKCGFGTAAQIFIHFSEFSESQQKILKVLVDRPVTDTSIISPSGFFRIHFNLSGSYIPQYNVNDFALALDSAYDYEVNYLGYPPPPPDTLGGVSPADAGGDSRYDVYIVPLSDYGETDFETLIGGNPGVPKFTSFMQVHYSFGSGFYTHGIDAARVTAAHEFHHSIQVGNYIFRDSDLFFYELTSTSMEEFVYDSINDYYGYMPAYFDNPEYAFASNAGYNLAIWNIFLKDLYGIGIIKRQWELMPQTRALIAINNSLYEEGTDFGNMLNKFGIWTFYTGYRAQPGKYFEEAANYPLIQFSVDKNFSPPVDIVSGNAHPTSNNFFDFINSASSDTLSVLVTYADPQKGIDSISSYSGFQYYLYNYNESGSQQLTDEYFSKLVTQQADSWTSSEFFNGYLIREGEIPAKISDYAFPDPFRFGKNSFIYFPVKGGNSTEADLNVYTSAMELVYSVNKPFDYFQGHKVLRWDGMGNNNKRVPSGVYIFITNSGNGKIVGKLVIFNE